MDSDENSSGDSEGQGVVISAESLRLLRRRLHELTNVFTGAMIAAALLSQRIEDGPLLSYVTNISEGIARGGELVRGIRSQLMEASGEEEYLPGGPKS